MPHQVKKYCIELRALILVNCFKTALIETVDTELKDRTLSVVTYVGVGIVREQFLLC